MTLVKINENLTINLLLNSGTDSVPSKEDMGCGPNGKCYNHGQCNEDCISELIVCKCATCGEKFESIEDQMYCSMDCVNRDSW